MNLSILMGEDEVDNRQIVRELLTSVDHTVREAITGFEKITMYYPVASCEVSLRICQRITGRCGLCDHHRIHNLMMLHNTRSGHVLTAP